ncbi:MAG: hypothetical protein ABI229_11825 [Gemmatimonadaceae bacterium]
MKIASIAAVPIAVLSIAVPANAQQRGQRELFDWRGRVDQEIRVEMQGGRTSVVAMGPREMPGYDNARAISGVPSTNGYVSVQMRQGRGAADVVQQPSARNGYTTIVRIRDRQSGARWYDVAAFWQPAGNYRYRNSGQYGQYGNNGRYDNDGRYDNNGRYDSNGRYEDDDQYGQDGRYGNYGQYRRYPSRVVVVQQPGKSLPSDNQGRQSGRLSDRSRGGWNQRGQPGQAGQSGKSLPGANRNAQQRDDGQRGH